MVEMERPRTPSESWGFAPSPYDAASASEQLQADENGSVCEIFEPTPSLWGAIAERVPVPEHDEVRRVIGQQLLDRNDSVREEVKALTEILEQFQSQTDEVAKKIAARPKFLNSQAKQLLESQIKYFIDSLDKKLTRKNKSVESIAQTAREKVVLDYVTQSSAAKPPPVPNRPPTRDGSVAITPRPSSSASSRPSTSYSSRPSSAGSSRKSGRSDDQLLDSINENLNAFDIDDVVDELRKALDEEHQSLLEDIEYLQSCMENEDNYHSEIIVPPPSMQELKEFGNKLESEVRKYDEKKEMKKKLTALPTVAPPASGRISSTYGEIERLEQQLSLAESSQSPARPSSRKSRDVASPSPAVTPSPPPRPTSSRSAQRLRGMVMQSREQEQGHGL